jgi:hypothetical protein
MLAAIALAYFGMYRGWRARVASQAAIAKPHAPSGEPTAAGPWSGTYLGATREGRWLDRVDVHALGARSRATLRLTAHAVDIEREAESSFSIPFSDLVSVRADKGIAGRAYEDGGIVVVTFRLGSDTIDIGLRFPETADHLAVLTALSQEVAS